MGLNGITIIGHHGESNDFGNMICAIVKAYMRHMKRRRLSWPSQKSLHVAIPSVVYENFDSSKLMSPPPLRGTWASGLLAPKGPNHRYLHVFSYGGSCSESLLENNENTTYDTYVTIFRAHQNATKKCVVRWLKAGVCKENIALGSASACMRRAREQHQHSHYQQNPYYIAGAQSCTVYSSVTWKSCGHKHLQEWYWPFSKRGIRM